MLRYDVTYWIGDLRAPEMDSNVTETYLRTLPTSLLVGQTAYARCLNGGRENDREIDAYGVHRVRP